MDRQPYHHLDGGVPFGADPRARCRDMAPKQPGDPDLFFPDAKGSRKNVAKARAICRPCELRDACREYAVARPWLVGVWGATSADDRTRIRVQRAPAAPRVRDADPCPDPQPGQWPTAGDSHVCSGPSKEIG